MNSPPWTVPAHVDDAIPDTVDVVVLGASLAGLSAACTLARGGARVVVLGEEVCGGYAARDAGLVLHTLAEHPHRLVHSVGAEQARAIVGFIAEGVVGLGARGLYSRCGSLAAAALPREDDELRAACAARGPAGPRGEGPRGEGPRGEGPGGEGRPADPPRCAPPLWEPDQVAARLRSRGFGVGWWQPDDGLVHPGEVVAALVDAARAAGARLSTRAHARSLAVDRGGVRVGLGEGALRAEAAVLCAGWRLPALDPWFADKVHPVRHQWIATAPVAPGRLPCAVTAQHHASHWRQLPDGRILAGGARFGSPHLEVGETDASSLHPRIDRILRANLARFFPDLDGVERTHAWAAIATHTCDGLPLLGPLPGRPALLACTGMQGLDHRLGLRAGEVVAEGLLTGRAPAVPRLFGAGRMV